MNGNLLHVREMVNKSRSIIQLNLLALLLGLWLTDLVSLDKLFNPAGTQCPQKLSAELDAWANPLGLQESLSPLLPYL